jgi:hypothetical protein
MEGTQPKKKQGSSNHLPVKLVTKCTDEVKTNIGDSVKVEIPPGGTLVADLS